MQKQQRVGAGREGRVGLGPERSAARPIAAPGQAWGGRRQRARAARNSERAVVLTPRPGAARGRAVARPRGWIRFVCGFWREDAWEGGV